MAQLLPASLNLETVLASTVARLRSIIDSDVTAVLVRDDTAGRWVVAAGEGTRVGHSFSDEELPASLASTQSGLALRVGTEIDSSRGGRSAALVTQESLRYGCGPG